MSECKENTRDMFQVKMGQPYPELQVGFIAKTE